MKAPDGLKFCYKETPTQVFFFEYCQIFIRTPTFKNIYERLLLHLFLIKARDAFAVTKIFLE